MGSFAGAVASQIVTEVRKQLKQCVSNTCIILEGWLNIIFVGYVESVMAKPILTVRVTTRAGMS